jgi:hypothetical protein
MPSRSVITENSSQTAFELRIRPSSGLREQTPALREAASETGPYEASSPRLIIHTDDLLDADRGASASPAAHA